MVRRDAFGDAGLLTVFDLAIVWLIWHEYRGQRALRAGDGGVPSV
jgi:uncharacterized membrane protein